MEFGQKAPKDVGAWLGSFEFSLSGVYALGIQNVSVSCPMLRLERHVWVIVQIDTNRINARRNLEYMNRIEQWATDDVIQLEMSQVAQEEAVAGGDRVRTAKAYGYVATETLCASFREWSLWQKIERILFPSGCKKDNEKRDVEVAFNAIKYEAILVTDDGSSKRQPGGFLGNRDRLKQLGLVVMRDGEAVRMVEGLIKKRDDLARRLCLEMRESLPCWVGED